ncbi:hypothetical protein MHBO_000444 [Bonamia ostreae]|uniref:Uncharacterized protein n=1 Tax=Bonamia ostreae TaxID=126728 RepID=A0ABV2AGA1_9EUKA
MRQSEISRTKLVVFEMSILQKFRKSCSPFSRLQASSILPQSKSFLKNEYL